MSLRTRLWLVLGGLFLLPLVVGGSVLAVLVPQARTDRDADVARTAASTVQAALRDTCVTLGLAARSQALEAAATNPKEAVAVVTDGGYADYAALLRPDGGVLAEAGRRAVAGGPPSRLTSCARTGSAAGAVLAERVPVQGVPGAAASVVARDLGLLARSLRAYAGPGAEVVLLAEGRVVAASDPSRASSLARAAEGRRGTVRTEGWTLQVQPADPLPYRVVVAVPAGERGVQPLPLVLIVGLGVLAAGLFVTLVARDLSRPYAELTEMAERVAHGDLDVEVETEEEGEAGRLGSALSLMTDELRRNLEELQRSREELRDSLERIGDALSATHDLDGLLQVVLDTAQATLGGAAGVVLYRSGEELQLAAELGLHEAGLSAPATLGMGQGVLGRVVSTGTVVRGTLRSGPSDLEPSDLEPGTGDILAVPLRSMGSVVGVLALYDRVDGRPFDTTDEDSLGTLAGQASIAIDNVHLHQEAQRLSTTDALTGLWNFRYLSMSLAREIERAVRFERPLAVLMLDLDHFKQVNDAHGHASGDMVLRELSDRVQEQIREVDTFARYGGEEFVVVLPETTVEGASQLAERICEAVRREPFPSVSDEPLSVTVSVGGAAFPQHGSSPATLMRAADRALYVAKNEGRDRWHVLEDPPG